MNKIAFYEERTFGDKFNVTFEFIKQNWKVILRYVTYVVLPLCLLGGLSLNVFTGSIVDVANSFGDDLTQMLPFIGSYFGIIIVATLASWWVATVMFSLIQVYNERPDGLQGVAFAELKPYFKRNAWRLFKLGVVMTILLVAYVCLAVGVAFVHWSFCALLVIALMVLVVPLMLVSPVYIYERVNVWTALLRGIRLGWNTWGGIFALGFVMALLASVAEGVIGMPWQICYFVKILFIDYGADSFSNSIWFSLISYVASIVMLYSQLLCSCLYFVAVSYLYSHAAEQLDDMSIEEGIGHFDDMADKNEDAEFMDFDKL